MDKFFTLKRPFVHQVQLTIAKYLTTLVAEPSLTESNKASRVADRATQKAADEPKHDPKGSLEVRMAFANLQLMPKKMYT